MWTERSKKYFPWPEVRVVSVKCCVYQEHGEHRATGARRPRPPRRHSTAARGREARPPPPVAAAAPLDRRSRCNIRTRRLRFLAWTFAARPPPLRAGSGDAPTRDCYALLGVSCRANAVALKRAYRKRSLEFHPDKGDVLTDEVSGDEGHVYDTLRDPRRREVYDALGHNRRGGRGICLEFTPDQFQPRRERWLPPFPPALLLSPFEPSQRRRFRKVSALSRV